MVLKETYRKTYSNVVADLAAATPTWEIRPSDYDRRLHGPFNIIWVFNNSDENLKLEFDSDSNNYVIIFPGTVFGTNLEDGLAFSFVNIENLDATDPAADEVRVRIARIKDVRGAV